MRKGGLPAESPRGSPSAMANAVFSRHASLSEQLRTASSNLQQSLDALGSMSVWDPDPAMSGRSPYLTTSKVGNGGASPANTPSPAVSSPRQDSSQTSLLIQRIQELETTQQRQLKEQGDLRMQLVEKDEKMRKMVAAHKRLKAKAADAPASPVQQRNAQSMEARKRAAEAAAKKAIAEKKDLQREVQKLKDQLHALTSTAPDGDGDGIGDALRRETAARIRAEHELAAARSEAAGDLMSPAGGAMKRERDALRHQVETLKAEMAKHTGGHRFTEGSRTPKATGSLLSQRTREEMESEKARLQADLEALSAAKLEVERQREVEVTSRTEAESRAREAEEHSAELHKALRSLERHCADLEGRETTMKEQQRMVAELRISTQAALVGEQQEEVDSVRQNEHQKREQAEKTLDQTVDEVVAQAEARFESTLTDIDHKWSGHVHGTEAAITAAKQAITDEYVGRISELTSALDHARSQGRELQQVADERAQELDNAKKRLEQDRLISEQKLKDAQAVVRADAETSAEQQIQAAKAEAEAGWSDLVDILQTQAQEAQQEMLTLRRRSADTQQALIQAETVSTELRKQVAKLHQDLSTAESRPAENPQAELERQELLSQLSTSEARAAKLEQKTAEMVKQARLDAEQKTLEDVEEIIQNLEDRNANLEEQVSELARGSGAEFTALEQRVAQLSADLSVAQVSAQDSMVQAADAAEKLAAEKVQRVQLQMEVDQLQLKLQAAVSEHPDEKQTADSRVLELSQQAAAAESRVAELIQQAADISEQLAAEKAQRADLQSEVDQLQLELQFAQTTAGETDDADVVDLRVAQLTEQLAAATDAAAKATVSTLGEVAGLETDLTIEKELRSQAELEVEQLKATVAELEEKARRAVEEAVPPEGPRVPSLNLDSTTLGSPQQLTIGAPGTENHVSMHNENLRALYAVADVNGDGNVSRAELVEALRRDPSLQSLFNLPIGKRLGPEERARIEAIFDDMDDDHSFGISFDEFS